MNKFIEITKGIYLLKDFINNSDKIFNELENLSLGKLTINNKILTKPGRFEGLNIHINDEIISPWLRCPSIENQIIYDFSNFTNIISDEIKQMGYITNIAKIQKYIDGSIIINSHSDKLLDLDENTPIFICRFGATRRCILTHKLNKEKIIVDMPHNSILLISYSANKEWQHGVLEEKDCGISYSIVLRNSKTFKYGNYIYGNNTPFKKITDLKDFLNNPNFDKYWSIDKQKNHIVKCYSTENKIPSEICLYNDIINNTIYP